MAEAGNPSSEAVVLAFLHRYVQDRAEGKAKSREEYLARFPGFEEVIEREYRWAEEQHGRAQSHHPTTEQLRERLGHVSDPAISLREPDSEILGDLDFGGPRGQRYRKSTELGRGGMGVVLRAWDPDIRRTVAMKVLQPAGPGATPDATALSRFLEEAQITGQLDHPGIVPVHELGLDAEGRLYYTMSLIRGRNLRQIIDLVHSGEEDWTRTRALGVLLRVCEAVAFAHSMGVVHRDLKPSNVMVGRFGETYVMDWGLARVLGREDCKDIRVRRDEAESVSSLQSLRRETLESTPDSPLVTMDGDVVGTPAYMAPEQAQGLVDRVGPHSDVYSIGAMLYHLLAGHMPYVPSGARLSSRSVLARVVEGPPSPLAAVARDVPPELEAICERAMARRPQERYADVRELAEDLRAFLESRVVRAWRTGALAEARKWMQRNKLGAAASVAAVLALAMGLILTLEQKSRADEHARRADASAREAESNFELAFSAGQDLLVQAGITDLTPVPGADPVRRLIAEKAVPYFERLLALRGDDERVAERVADAHFKLSLVHRQLGRTDLATRHLEESERRYEKLVRDYPENDHLGLQRAAVRNARAFLLRRLGRYADALSILESQVEVWRELAERIPPSSPHWAYCRICHADCHNLLGNCLQDSGQHEAALGHRREALRISEAVASIHPEDRRNGLGHAYLNLGNTLMALQRYDEALVVLEKARQFFDRALQREKGSRFARWFLANAYGKIALVRKLKGDNAEAKDAFEPGIELLRSLTRDFPTWAPCHGELGGALCNYSDIPEVEGDRERALQLAEEAVAEIAHALEIEPTNTSYRRYLRFSYERVFNHLNSLGRYDLLAKRAEQSVVDPDSAYDWYMAAHAIARCLWWIERDEELDSDTRAMIHDTYVKRAVEMLSEARSRGYSKPFAEKVFNRLRGLPEFQELEKMR